MDEEYEMTVQIQHPNRLRAQTGDRSPSGGKIAFNSAYDLGVCPCTTAVPASGSARAISGDTHIHLHLHYAVEMQ